jgi:hypothetical protein
VLPAVAVVVAVLVVVAILVIDGSPRCTAAIANVIAIAAPGWRIIGSAMATALLFWVGWAIIIEIE